jgi:hypothetical protein
MFHLHSEIIEYFSQINAVETRVWNASYFIRAAKTIENVVAGSSQQYSTNLHHQRWW